MKFGKSKELEKFIEEKKLIDGFSSIKEIYTGGSSYNFIIRANISGEEKAFLLKLVANFEGWEKITDILSVLGETLPLNTEKFENYYLLSMPYIEGKKLRYQDCSPELFSFLGRQYKKMQQLNNGKITIGNANVMTELKERISTGLEQKTDIFFCLIKHFFWQRILPELSERPLPTELIHGDLTANNILVDKTGQVHLLDYGCLRFGYAIEDFAGLVLQLSGFRGLFGSLRRFSTLKKMLEDSGYISASEWLYGVQMVYLLRLARRLRNTKKRGNLRKNLCLFITLLGYFRLAAFLRSSK